MWQTGYCTNIHAGIDFAAIVDNLKKYSAPVRKLINPAKPLGVGLWIPSEAADHLNQSNCAVLCDTLQELKLTPYTINGFPFGNFHQAVVKHNVYLPTWADPKRELFTRQLATILHQLLPADAIGSISTLPLGWGTPNGKKSRNQRSYDQPSQDHDGSELEVASGHHLRRVAEFLRRLELDSGRRIVLAIEPEPGCSLDTSTDVCEFFDRQLPTEMQRRYVTVCHDICHAAVMNEPQDAVLQRYVKSGLTIGKVQVSSAIEVRWSELDQPAGQAALSQLQQFAEDRYLHQTGVVDDQGRFRLVEDLPLLLAETTAKPTDQMWRIHFHVPIFLESFGHLWATRADVLSCLRSLNQVPPQQRINHLEVETYAWSVLPESMRNQDLPQSIASELIWLEEQLAKPAHTTPQANLN